MNAEIPERGRPASSDLASKAVELSGTSAASSPSRAGRPRFRVWRAVGAVWKLGFGALCGMSFVGSFLVVGWSQRAAQREVLKTWWKRSAVRQRGMSFADFTAGDGRTAEHASWPDWFFGARAFWPQRDGSAEDFGAVHRSTPVGAAAAWKTALRRCFGSLALNAKLGAQAAFNTAVLTLPEGLLWAFAWYAGWQNSFNKGYENALIGPLAFSLGILLFIAAMFYVPLAQARQASTGDWRSFYQFKLVWRLIRRRWLANAGLALFAVALAFPMNLFKPLPQAFPQMFPGLMDLSPVEQLNQIERYYFLTAIYGVAAFVAFRLMAARVYAGAVCGAAQTGAISEEELADGEWEALHRLGLLGPREQPVRPWFVKLVAWVATRTGRITAGIATFLVWLLFVFNVMTVEFFHFHVGGRGWWNQPLIQLPWFDYTPKHLRETAKAAKAEAAGQDAARVVRGP